MDAVVTLKARNKMLRARAGEIPLPKIVGFAFGDGGVDDPGNVLTPDTNQEELNSELLRKEIDSYTMISETKCKYECTLENEELAGESISEIALYDTDGDLVAIKNCTPKGKDGDFEMKFEITDCF